MTILKALRAAKELGEVLLRLLFVESIHDGVVVALEYVELGVVFVGLTVGEGHYHEVSFEVLHAGSLPEDGRHCFVGFWFSHFHVFGVVAATENVVSLQCLARVASHPAFYTNCITLLLLYADRDELRDLWADGMVHDMFLLKCSDRSHLIAGKETLLVIQ